MFIKPYNVFLVGLMLSDMRFIGCHRCVL